MIISITNLPWGAMVLCFLANTLLAMLWYQPFFLGKAWKEFTGQPIEGPPNPRRLIPSLCCTALYIITMTVILSGMGISTIGRGMITGALVGIGIVGATALPIHIYDGHKMKHFYINFGLTLANSLINGAILGWAL